MFSGFDGQRHTFRVLESIAKEGHDVVEFHDGYNARQMPLTAENLVRLACDYERTRRELDSASKGYEQKYALHHEERARLEKERDDYTERLRQQLERNIYLESSNKILKTGNDTLTKQNETLKKRLDEALEALHLRPNLVTPKNPEGNNMYITTAEYDELRKRAAECAAYRREAQQRKSELDAERSTVALLRMQLETSRQKVKALADKVAALEAMPVDALRYVVTERGKSPAGYIGIKGTESYSLVIRWLNKFFPPKPKTVEEMRGGLHAAGRAKYGDKWDSVRHTLAFAVSDGRTRSTKDLTRTEYERMLDMVQDAE